METLMRMFKCKLLQMLREGNEKLHEKLKLVACTLRDYQQLSMSDTCANPRVAVQVGIRYPLALTGVTGDTCPPAAGYQYISGCRAPPPDVITPPPLPVARPGCGTATSWACCIVPNMAAGLRSGYSCWVSWFPGTVNTLGDEYGAVGVATSCGTIAGLPPATDYVTENW